MELHAGEGGTDSKLFIHDLASAYIKYSRRSGLDVYLLTKEPGCVVLSVTGKEAYRCFQNEPGKHCVQRVPPTERGGRVHTSTVSVAVLEIAQKIDCAIMESEIEIQVTRGSGPGGQSRNKLETAIRAIHKPTGMHVFICNERSQHQNRATAIEILSAKVLQRKEEKQRNQLDQNRISQLGNRGRGDKIRTYNFKESRVVDHRLGTKTNKVDEVMNGHFELIFRKE